MLVHGGTARAQASRTTTRSSSKAPRHVGVFVLFVVFAAVRSFQADCLSDKDFLAAKGKREEAIETQMVMRLYRA